MSSKFKGKNSNDTVRGQAINRAKYLSEAFERNEETGKIHESITDFNFSERVYYGRIDADMNVVIPLPDKMTTTPSGKFGERAVMLSIIKDMFEDFRSKFLAAGRVGNIPSDDPWLSQIKIYKSHESAVSLYETYLKEMLETFNLSYLTIPQNQNDVMNFDDYMVHLSLIHI